MTEKNKRFTKGIIKKREDLTNDLWKIWIEPEEKINFVPGQYCTVGYNDIERPYSIVSSPNEDLIELFVELVPQPLGNLTPLLYELNIGSEITLRKKPKGIFKFQSQFKNHIMVSTVTGVAPFVSMIRSIDFTQTDYNIWVFEGASYIDEFGYLNELTSISQKNKKVDFIPTCSRPNDPKNAQWKGKTGRVNEIFNSICNLEKADKENTIIYACGHPEMVSDVSEKYSDKFNFIEEKFWKP